MPVLPALIERAAASPGRLLDRPGAGVGKLLRSADFERVLRTRPRASSGHFALHHLGRGPSRPPKRGPCTPPGPGAPELSTAEVPMPELPVDGRLWLGAVVPKRHARRAVTRSLLKRQIRAVVERHRERLAGGCWVVRLRAPFDRARFVSAASEALRQAVHGELEALFGHVVGPARGR